MCFSVGSAFMEKLYWMIFTAFTYSLSRKIMFSLKTISSTCFCQYEQIIIRSNTRKLKTDLVSENQSSMSGFPCWRVNCSEKDSLGAWSQWLHTAEAQEQLLHPQYRLHYEVMSRNQGRNFMKIMMTFVYLESKAQETILSKSVNELCALIGAAVNIKNIILTLLCPIFHMLVCCSWCVDRSSMGHTWYWTLNSQMGFKSKALRIEYIQIYTAILVKSFFVILTFTHFFLPFL